MKKLTIIALVLTLAMSLFAGCRSRREDMNSTTTTTQARMPDTADMLPDRNDTIDPSSGADNGMVDPTNGANHSTAPTGTTGHTAPTDTTGTMPRGKTRPMH